MCASVYVMQTPPIEIETQAQMLAFLGRPLTYIDDAPDGAKDGGDQCLCWVDVMKVAEAAGYSVAFDGMDYEWRKIG